MDERYDPPKAYFGVMGDWQREPDRIEVVRETDKTFWVTYTRHFDGSTVVTQRRKDSRSYHYFESLEEWGLWRLRRFQTERLSLHTALQDAISTERAWTDKCKEEGWLD